LGIALGLGMAGMASGTGIALGLISVNLVNKTPLMLNIINNKNQS
jgi:hypothetical protein